MTTSDRRQFLTLAIGGAGAFGAGALANRPVAGPAGDENALMQAVQAKLATIEQIDKGLVLAPGLRRLFADGATIAGPVGPGRYLLTANPLRAIVMLPIRHRGRQFDIAVRAVFAPSASDSVALVSLDEAVIDPLAGLDTPIGHAEIDMADPQTHYDRLATEGGGVLSIPPGKFALNLILHSRHVHLTGAGRGATLLVPRDPETPVLRALYRDGSWDYVTIANLTIGGTNGRGIGFAAGADTYVRGDEFAGRTRLVNVGFSDLTVAIKRQAGQIGLTLDQCGFGAADWHLYSSANTPNRGEIMHAGILTARDCHFTGARLGVAHIDSPVAGTGGVLFDNCVMERNPGFVFHVPAFANMEGVTDFVVRDCWNEANATAGTVTIGMQSKTVCYASFSNTGMVRFSGTPLGSLRLQDAVVETRNCPLDNLTLVEKDSSSTLRHDDARGFGSYAPIGLVTSVAAAAQSEPPGRALTFVIPHRTHIGVVPDADVRLSQTSGAPFVLVGSEATATHSVNSAVLPGMTVAQQVALRQGMRIFPPPVTIPAQSWIVWLFAYQLVAGTGPFFQVSGDRGISARRRLDSPGWETVGGMAEVAPGAQSVSLWMIQEDAAAEVRLGGYNLVAFKDRQAALNFLNSNILAITKG
jgi:hypothetical protein